MIRSLRWILVAVALALFASVPVGCGSGDECQKNGDCKDKDDGKKTSYTCRLVDGTRKCVASSNNSNNNTNTCPSACFDNLDCANCPDQRIMCISGVCAKEGTAPECPNNCSNNADCAKCPDGKTSCEGGSCVEPLVQCPSSCSQDSDCSSCDGGRSSCQSGVCSVPPNTNCPTSCSQSSECAQCSGGNNYCVQGKCGTPPGTCPSSCQTEGDCFNCPGGLTACINNRCTDPGQTCPQSCSSDSQCTPCSDGRTKCDPISQTCTNPSSNCPTSCLNDSQCGLCPDDKKACVNGTCQKQAPPQCPSSCVQDSQCAVCSGGRTSCVNGICDVPNNTGCPNSCTSDSQCGLCLGGRTSCVGGTCQTPPCPNSCVTNSDCSPCSAGRTECRGGTCQQPQQQCPSICTRDSECANCPSGQTSCVGSRCTSQGSCPSSCTSSTQCALCPSGRTSCVAGQCTTGGSTCPPICTSDAQCAGCSGGRTKCDRSLGIGICSTGGSSSGKAQVGETCSSSKPCDTGLLCVTIDGGSSYCFQECQSASNCSSNTDGRTSCIPFIRDSQGQIRNACLAENSVGQSCGFGVNKQQICQRSQDPPLYCNKSGTCAAAVVQKTVGARCNKQGDTTEPIAICDDKSNLVCDDSTGKCVTAVQASEGQACGSKLAKPAVCQTGFDCITFDANGSVGRCHKICQPSASGQCTHRSGLTCMRAFADGRGLCMDLTCTSDSSCAFSGYRCQTPQTGGKRCVPASDFGGICGGFLECKVGLSCLTAPNAQESFCSKTCTSNASCPTVDGKTFTCVTQGTARYCLRRCTSDASCPFPLTCETVGTDRFCAAK